MATSDSYSLMRANAKRISLATKVLELWDEFDVDLLITPAFSMPAQPLGYPSKQLKANSYTRVFNTLNFPAGCVKVGHESEEDQKALKSYAGDPMIKEGTEGALGMPLNVQVVGRPWREELLLRLLKEIERH